jgi:branched-chain amino acid transport system ATP-binding protein
MPVLLEVKNISKQFGGLLALDAVSLTVESGETLGLIGPNGSGKSTLFNVIAGTFPPTSGSVHLDSMDITGSSANSVAKHGIARTFQSVRPFMNLSVWQNVLVAALYGNPHPAKKLDPKAKAQQVLELVGLADKSNLQANQLTVMQRKWLEIARALATEPKLLLLDEFMAGLNPTEVQEAVEFIKRLKAMNITVIVVEHIMKAIMSCSDRIVVLNAGRKIAEGSPTEIVNNQAVISAYLGTSYVRA